MNECRPQLAERSLELVVLCSVYHEGIELIQSSARSARGGGGGRRKKAGAAFDGGSGSGGGGRTKKKRGKGKKGRRW